MRVLRYLTAAAAAAATLAAGTTATPAAIEGTKTRAVTAAQVVTHLRHGIQWHRSMTWRYQDRAGRPRTRTVYIERRVRSVPFLRWVDRLWATRQHKAHHYLVAHQRRARPSVGAIAHMALWECIHRGEGAWNANTGNGYYGGLQMTISWGGLIYRADLHSPYEQMAAAETGYRRSGYSIAWLEGQWPNTSPPCLGYAH